MIVILKVRRIEKQQYVKNDNECIVLDDDGFIVKKLTRVVGTWKVLENVDVDEFLERMFENL